MKFSENASPDRGTSGNDACGNAENALHILGQFWAAAPDFFHIMKNARAKSYARLKDHDAFPIQRIYQRFKRLHLRPVYDAAGNASVRHVVDPESALVAFE